MSDPETLAVYDRSGSDYADRFARKNDPEQAADAAAFLALLPAGGRILDLGCGPGQWAATFADAGFAVEATDASEEMARLASTRFGVHVRVEPFEALADTAHFDGIWANFSLLHAPRSEMPDHLARIHRALKPGGALHLAMKLGSGEARDRLGRFYTYYGEEELAGLLAAAGFTLLTRRRADSEGFAGGSDAFLVLTARA